MTEFTQDGAFLQDEPDLSYDAMPQEPDYGESGINALGDNEHEVPGTVEVKFTTGPAGSGKTYLMREAIKADPSSILLCATTGVAAVNLGTVTLNSVLRFFNTENLADQYITGRLQRTLGEIAKRYRALGIDEISMMDGRQLSYIYQAASEANARNDKKLAIYLTGDFCQLAPVNAPWAFQSDVWPEFAKNTVKLDKMWRQSNQGFLEALNFSRAGKAKETVEKLRELPTKWAVGVDNNFMGTTIMSKNKEVDRYNNLRYMSLQGQEKIFKSDRWGKLRKEWEQIPPYLRLKIGTYVMILTNEPESFLYANGDCGVIQRFDTHGVWVTLARNNSTVFVPFLTRRNEGKDEPTDSEVRQWAYYDEKKRRWVYGAITYMPLRLAYAATVHKTQGLTLDAIQVDVRDHFFGSPGMAYVSLSRVKSPEGLRIVGTPQILERRINTAPEVKDWI